MSVKFDKAIISVKPFTVSSASIYHRNRNVSWKMLFFWNKRNFLGTKNFWFLTFDSISCKRETSLPKKKTENWKLIMSTWLITARKRRQYLHVHVSIIISMCFVIVYSYIKNASWFSHGCHHSRECDRPKGLCDHLPEGKSNSLLRVNLPCKLLTITKRYMVASALTMEFRKPRIQVRPKTQVSLIHRRARFEWPLWFVSWLVT